MHSRKPAMHALAWLLLSAAALATTPPALAQAAPRSPVRSEQVLAAIQAHGWAIEGVQVVIAAPMTATVAEPALEIQSITMLTAHRVRLRMACRAHTACLPFFAIATWPERTPPESLPPELRGRSAAGNEPLRGEKQELHLQPPAVGPQRTTPPTLRAGAAATLVIDAERIHIRLQVVCLDSGVPGDKVRVTTRDHKQAYTAEIVAPTTLKGSL